MNQANNVTPVKLANEAFLSAAQTATSKFHNNEALKNLGKALLAGAGAGAAGRGILGLTNLVSSNITPPATGYKRTSTVEVPYYDDEEEAEEKTAGLLDFLKGDSATSEAGIPWVTPAHVLGVPAAAMGGWAGVDYLMDKRRKAKLNSELEEAEEDFQSAMLSQHDKPKTAGEKLGSELDSLFGNIEKAAGLNKEAGFWGDVAGRGAGAYGAYAGLSSLIAGLGAYSYAKKRSKSNLLAKAQKRRARRQYQNRPTEIFALPVPVSQPQDNQSTQDQEELEDEAIA